jgi:hypothetical protein
MTLGNKEKYTAGKSSTDVDVFINENASALSKVADKFRRELSSKEYKVKSFVLNDDVMKEIQKAQKISNESNEKFKKEFLEKFKNDLNKKVNEDIKKLEDKIIESNEEIKKSEYNFNNKIESSRIKIIETLGIFVALFTFVSVEFQMFRIFHRADSVGGLTLILLGSLISFLLILDFVINSSDNIKTKFYPMIIFSAGLIGVGVYIFISSPQEKLSIDNEVRIENQGSSMQINGNSLISPTGR